MRAYTRSTPYQVSAEKRRSYIERYQDRWDRRSDKTDIYSYIEPFISLLPEECVVGKAKRKWHAQTRGVDIDHPDVTELFGPLEDEEDGEEQSREDDEDESVEGENDLEDDDLEFEKMSDDESYGEDDGPDGTHQIASECCGRWLACMPETSDFQCPLNFRSFIAPYTDLILLVNV